MPVRMRRRTALKHGVVSSFERGFACNQRRINIEQGFCSRRGCGRSVVAPVATLFRMLRTEQS